MNQSVNGPLWCVKTWQLPSSKISKHLSHTKMEPPSCFSCKIYILWVVPFLQNRMVWISTGCNWSGVCSVLRSKWPPSASWHSWQWWATYWQAAIKVAAGTAGQAIDVGLPAVASVVSNWYVHCLCTSGTFLYFWCYSKIN